MEHPVVEHPQVVGTEPADPEMANGGEDVPVDLPPVPSQVESARLILFPGSQVLLR
jgi:hypothetical protein